jgi:hypothetical protein
MSQRFALAIAMFLNCRKSRSTLLKYDVVGEVEARVGVIRDDENDRSAVAICG